MKGEYLSSHICAIALVALYQNLSERLPENLELSTEFLWGVIAAVCCFAVARFVTIAHSIVARKPKFTIQVEPSELNAIYRASAVVLFILIIALLSGPRLISHAAGSPNFEKVILYFRLALVFAAIQILFLVAVIATRHELVPRLYRRSSNAD